MATSATPVQLIDPATGLPYSAAPAAQTSTTTANPGSQSTQATSVQGITGGNPVPVNGTVNVGNFPATQPVSIANGSNVAEGNTADAAYTGSGSASIVALLKGAYNALLAPTPAGTNSIGSVTITNGSNAAEGNTADAAYTGSGSASIVAILKGIYTQAVNFVTGQTSGTQQARAMGVNPSTSAQTQVQTDAQGLWVTTRGGAAIASNQVAVAANTATQIVPLQNGRQKILLSPTSSVAYYLGSSGGVTTSNGFFVAAGGSVTLDTVSAVWVISATAHTMSYVILA